MSARQAFEPFTYITSHPQGIPLKIVDPTPEFVREVERAMDDSATPRELAQWVADRIEEHGSQHARPVFSIEGSGPFCSYCGAIGAICGHPDRAIGGAS